MILTGKIRYRLHSPWLGKPALILQVEEKGYLIEYIVGHIEGHDVQRWRDARVEDLKLL